MSGTSMAGRFGTERRPDKPRPGLLSVEAIGLLTAVGYLAIADPHDRGAVMPHCPIKVASGWDCPSCGGLRAVHDLLHGEVRRALADNLFLVVTSPVLVYLLYQHVRTLRSGERYEIPEGLAYGLLVTACAWGVLRNRPGWRWKPILD
jgi:hypothetical protein